MANRGEGPPCPVDPKHGRLLLMEQSEHYYCPHQDHDGRSARHPMGPATATRNRWSRQELEAFKP